MILVKYAIKNVLNNLNVLWFSTKTDFDEAVFLSDKHSI